MIAQFVLSLGLMGCLFYAFSLGRSLPVVRLGLFAVVLTALIFVWFPQFSNDLAKIAGIGRGADLIIYLWIVLSLFLIFRLHLKLREQSENLTKLSRMFALMEGGGEQAGEVRD